MSPSLYMTSTAPMSGPRPVSHLEVISKAAAVASVGAIVLLQLAFHPDLTGTLRAVAAAALILGWLGGRSQITYLLFLAAAAIAPAVLRLLTGREGPVLDLFWMAGLAGALTRGVPWARWDLPGWWRILLGGWALTLALVWPVVVAREIGFDPRVLRDNAVINGWSQVTAPQAVHWTLYVVFAHLLGVLWLEWLMARFASAPARMPRAGHGLWIGTTAASLVAIYQGTVSLEFLSTPTWVGIERMPGTLLDANAFGMAAAIAAPLAFVAIRQSGIQHATVLGLVVLGVNLAGMWMSGSRTALLCGGIGMLALVSALWKTRGPATRGRVPAVAVTAAVSLVVLIGLSAENGPVQRLAQTPLDVRALWERDGYGPPAVRMFQEYPLTGAGPGSYSLLLQDEPTSRTLPFDNAQNWWRHQGAELGLLGSLPIFLWSLLVAALVLAGRAAPGHIVTATTLRAVVLGVGIASLVGMPTQNPYVLLWFFFLVAWMRALMQPSVTEPPARARAAHLGWAAVTFMAVVFAGGHLLLALGPLGVAERAVRTDREYVVGAYAPQRLDDETEFRWTRERARFIWPVSAPWLVIRVWASHPDIAEQAVHITLSTPCGIILDEALDSSEPVSLLVELPESLRTVQASLHVSRTWRPAAHEQESGRRLGVGITKRFTSNPEDSPLQMRTVTLPHCDA